MLNFKNNNPRIVLLALALFSLAGTTLADSARIKWIGNGHYYQGFSASKTWFDAQSTCQQLSAHLVTITSIAEDSFIYTSGVRNITNYPWIGASDAAKEGTYTWVTGEKWSYANWVPSPYAGSSYPDYDYSLYSGSKWDNERAIYTNGYICEWSAPNYIDVTSVPDLNNNRFSETAALYVDFVTGKHTVKIKDPQTQGLLSTLTFQTNFNPPQGLVALADINGNRIPEIAVLYNELNQPSVGIKDAKNNGALLKTLRFLGTAFEPKAITATPDTNGNGASEITVLGINKTSGQAKSETRDSKTGALLKSIVF
jgi:Lectin C-type domain